MRVKIGRMKKTFAWVERLGCRKCMAGLINLVINAVVMDTWIIFSHRAVFLWR
jgi:hypothetical protein